MTKAALQKLASKLQEEQAEKSREAYLLLCRQPHNGYSRRLGLVGLGS